MRSKKIIIVLLVGLHSILGVAQNNVGIGTTTPTNPLEIEKMENTSTPNFMFKLHNPVFMDSSSALMTFSVSPDQSWNPSAIGFIRGQGLVFQTHWNSGSPLTRMMINYDGKVGIGKTNPVAQLDIDGNLSLGISTPESSDINIVGTDALISLGADSDGPHGFSFGDEGDQGLQLLYRSAPNQLIVEKGNTYEDLVDLFSIDYDTEYSYFKGNLGLGTTSPSAKLDVVGTAEIGTNTSSVPDLKIVGEDALISLGEGEIGPHGIAFGDNGTEGLQLMYRSSLNRFLIEKGNDFANNTDLFFVDYDTEYGYFKGRLGLGIATPKPDVHICEGNTNLSHTIAGFSSSLGITGNTNTARIYFEHTGSNPDERVMANSFYQGKMYWSSLNDDATSIIYQNILVLDPSGQVAIGSDKFASGHKLSVDGKIACEEIRVELSQSWPDYVFEDTYALKSLDEVKNYITTNGHLPGIPNATQVEEEGLVLGEMNRKMMEKIEELTLYILQQDERIKAMEKQIQNLKN